MRFSDHKAQATGCHTARRARCSRGTPLGTRHLSGTQWQSYRDPISRPCLAARPAPSPGPHGGLRSRCSRGRSRGRQPPDTETTPRDCPSSSDTCPPRPTVHYPPLARSHHDDRGHGGHDACDGRDEDLEDLPPRSHREQPRLHGSPRLCPHSLTLPHLGGLSYGPTRSVSSGQRESRGNEHDRLRPSSAHTTRPTTRLRSNCHLLQGACAPMRTNEHAHGLGSCFAG